MPLYCIFQSSVRLKYKHKILILSQVFTIFAFKPTKLDIISNQTNLLNAGRIDTIIDCEILAGLIAAWRQPKFEYHFSEQDPRCFHIFFSRCAESIRQSKRAVVHESIFIPHLNKMCNLTLETREQCQLFDLNYGGAATQNQNWRKLRCRDSKNITQPHMMDFNLIILYHFTA